MALILRGKNKGHFITISQFCNDWFSLINGDIVSPLSIKLNAQEQAEVKNAERLGRTGMMFQWFELLGDGKFRRRKAN
jgi:hypothetical protein